MKRCKTFLQRVWRLEEVTQVTFLFLLTSFYAKLSEIT